MFSTENLPSGRQWCLRTLNLNSKGCYSHPIAPWRSQSHQETQIIPKSMFDVANNITLCLPDFSKAFCLFQTQDEWTKSKESFVWDVLILVSRGSLTITLVHFETILFITGSVWMCSRRRPNKSWIHGWNNKESDLQKPRWPYRDCWGWIQSRCYRL